jgi:ribonuclease BN (tRNA processing enzyme)
MKKNFSKIIFVGTASGKTSAKRNHSSFLIKTSNHNLLVDAGDGIAKALLQQEIKFTDIDSILFTHYHADHFTGIAALITQMKLVGRKNPLILFTHKNLVSSLESLLNSVYMFKNTLGFELDIIGFDFDKDISVNNSLSFTAKRNSHIVQKENLRKYPKKNFVSSSILFRIGNKNLFYTSDISSEKDLYLFSKEKLDFVISEAAHIKLEDLLSFYRETNPGKLFLTHYDDSAETNLKKWHKQLKPIDRKKIIISTDGFDPGL